MLSASLTQSLMAVSYLDVISYCTLFTDLVPSRPSFLIDSLVTDLSGSRQNTLSSTPTPELLSSVHERVGGLEFVC
jgi:hypothetical protein